MKSTLILVHRKSFIKTFFGIAIVGVYVLSMLFFDGHAHAFTPSYNPNDLIDDATFLNNSSMSQSDIQAFLANIGSGLANFYDTEACNSTTQPLYSHCGQSVLASQIIYDASRAYGMNPRDILATMEKEQSLITDPTPADSQLNCAMGYESCGVVGFFNQVDSGTWQLRANEARASGQSFMGLSPSSYPCKNADSSDNPELYNNGLLPGNTVTFTDPAQYYQGNLVHAATPETITIANASTAALYCYTPYVGPSNVTGYSGSYNFVYYYQLWFGSTQASTPYSWVAEGQSSYTDSGYSDPFTGGDIYMAPGQTAYLSVDARNVGYDTWQNNVVYLSTDRPPGGSSPFYNAAWNSPGTISMQQSSVAPGEDATFQFPITAPSQTGTYNEYFTMVAEGITWLNDPGMYFTINVVQPQDPTLGPSNELTAGQSLSRGEYMLSPESQSALEFSSSGNVILYADGQAVWSNGVDNSNANQFVMQPDGNLVEYASGGQVLWSSGTSASGNYLALQSDGNLVEYNSGNSALWSSGTSANPSYDYRVDQTIPSGGILFPGQTVENASGSCRLAFQTNGNLVEYNSSNQILWASNTGGENSALLAMQPDGNLVIYNASGQAIWSSSTFMDGASLVMNTMGGFYLGSSGGSSELFSGETLYDGQEISANNYTLIMQPDGNLVLYDPDGNPIWSSGTNAVAYAVLQPDGNLVLYGSRGAVWSSGTSGNGSVLAMQTDGNLVIYKNSGQSAVWSSGTVGE